MTDTLRDRIAAVQSAHQAFDWGCQCGWEYDALVDDSHFDHVADAVIRELNLDISHTYKTSQGREVCIEGFWTEEATDGTA